MEEKRHYYFSADSNMEYCIKNGLSNDDTIEDYDEYAEPYSVSSGNKITEEEWKNIVQEWLDDIYEGYDVSFTIKENNILFYNNKTMKTYKVGFYR